MCFAVIASLALLRAEAACAESQREQVLREAKSLEHGARLVSTMDGEVLIATAFVAFAEMDRQDAAFATASFCATVEARAEAALFLDGSYSSASESARAKEERSGGESVQTTWISRRVASAARVRLTDGEPVLMEQHGGGVRVVLAWGLADAERTLARAPDRMELGARARRLLEETGTPTCLLRWVRTEDGQEGLQIDLSIYPDAPVGPAVYSSESVTRVAKDHVAACPCMTCRESRLGSLLAMVVAGWLQEGDVQVSRVLVAESARTVSRARSGAEAISRMNNRVRIATTVEENEASFRHMGYVRAYSSNDRKAVCSAFVPLRPQATGAAHGGPADARVADPSPRAPVSGQRQDPVERTAEPDSSHT